MTIGHEASVSKVGEEQVFYLMSRGIAEDEPEGETEQPHKGDSESSRPEEVGEGTGEAASIDELLNQRLVASASDEQREMWLRTMRAAQRVLPRGRGRRRPWRCSGTARQFPADASLEA